MHALKAAVLAATSFAIAAPAAATEFQSDPKRGNSVLNAVFEAPLGERISAVSSSVDCKLDIDAKTGKATGKCSVQLNSIMVDGNATKTDHFYEWSTNKKVAVNACKFELPIDGTASAPLEAGKAVPFSFDAAFTLCGRAHEKGSKEKVTGTITLIPAGKMGPGETVRISATIKDFNREAYHVGPAWTGGWMAKVQALAPVVAAKGTVQVNIFATAKPASKS